MGKKKGGNLTLVFVPLEEMEGIESDPLEEILRVYVRCTGEILYKYEQERHKWEEQHINDTQKHLLEIHLKAMEEIIALGYSPQAASEMLGRPTVEHFK